MGSGIGVARMVASVEFESRGIEIGTAFITVAERLAFNSSAWIGCNIACGTFVTAGVDGLIGSAFAENDGSISLLTEVVDVCSELGR